ncbi:hypothetical protein JL722_2777 [Aureococcus anophagefferens]|nr:hypothetical protein JL722_2777 [Aureococcus anophagefferens]
MALKRVVVFGGNGFVGSAVLQRLAGVAGVEAVSVSRSGSAPAHAATWGDAVDWRAGDALDAATFGDALDGAAAVVASVGTPPLPGADRRDNGDTVRGVLAAAPPPACPRGRRRRDDAALARVPVRGLRGGQARRRGGGRGLRPPRARRRRRQAHGGLRHAAHEGRRADPALARARAREPRAPRREAALRSPRGARAGAFAGLLDPPVPVDAVAAAVVDGCFSDAYRDAFAVLGPDDIARARPERPAGLGAGTSSRRSPSPSRT